MSNIFLIQYTSLIILLVTFILFLVFNIIFKWNMVINVLSPLIDKNTDYMEVGLIETKNLKFLETINITFLIFANLLWFYLYGLTPHEDISYGINLMTDIEVHTIFTVIFTTIFLILLYFGPTIMLFISIHKRNMINKLKDARLKGEKDEMKYYCKGLEKLRNIFAFFIVLTMGMGVYIYHISLHNWVVS